MHRVILALAALLALLSVGAFVRDHHGSLYDDAFIYFRYVDHLLAGCGLRYNCQGAQVEGFSSPLYFALLVLGALATPRLETVALVIGVGSTILSLGFAGLAAYRLASGATIVRVGLGVMTVLVLAGDHFFLLNGVIGLEAALAAAIVTGLLLLATIEESSFEPALLATAVTLAILARPESAAFAPAVLLLPGSLQRRLRALAIVATLVVLMTVVRLAVFGDVLPNTAWAKAGGTWAHARLGAEYIGSVFRAFPVIVLVPLAIALRSSSRRITLFFVVGSALWLGGFLRTGGDHFDYARLAVPLVPGLAAIGFAGLGASFERLASVKRPGERAGITALAASVILSFVLQRHAVTKHRLAPSHGFENVKRWEATGRYLKTHHPGALIATVPIGAVGYFSDSPLIDLVGLVVPEIAKSGRSIPPDQLTRRWIGHERHFTEWVFDQKPDLIVMTAHKSTPWVDLAETRAGFWAEWLALRAIKEGLVPYRLSSAEVQPGVHVLLFVRSPDLVN